jgi:hypothetical protein
MLGKVGLHILFLARQNINHKRGGWSSKRIFAAVQTKVHMQPAIELAAGISGNAS